MATSNKQKKENYEMQNMVGTLILTHGKNPSMSSTPYHYGHHLDLGANFSLLHH